MKNTSNCRQNSLEIDLHGMTAAGAKAALDAYLKTVPTGATVSVIHGSNNGTVLQRLVRSSYKNKRIERKIIGLNQGETDFIIK